MTKRVEGKKYGKILVPFTGQSAGLIKEILPAGEIVQKIVAEEALRKGFKLLA